MVKSLGTTQDHADLADFAREFAQGAKSADGDPRSVPYQNGARPASWKQLVETGFNTVHIDEGYGGGAAGLMELAVVVEQFGAELYPGPFLATVTCSAILTEIDQVVDREVLGSALTALASGGTGAVILESGLRADRNDQGITLHGRAENVLGAGGADTILARVELDGADRWVVLPRESVVVRTSESLDITRDLGEVDLKGVVIKDSALVPGVDLPKALRIRAALMAAEASGISSRTVEDAVQHASTRTQFRRKISSFQAIQQRLALMHMRTEVTRAVAWDAVRGRGGTPDEERALRNQVSLSALSGTIDDVFDYVSTLGAIGFTWEHDAHLYWRRALQLGALEGPQAQREFDLGEAAMTGVRTISIAEEDDLPALRSEINQVLDGAGDPEDGVIEGSPWAPRKQSAWQQALAEAKLVAPHIKEPYGRAADPLTQAVILEEFSARGLKPPSLVIGDWVVPTIAEHGTEQQQQRFIPPTLRGDVIWCQLFSEPGAGSDLGSLTARAVKVDGGWRINGQKVWNSLADIADLGALLVRTEPEVSGSRGLGFVLLDMTSDGVEVRAIRQATGLAEFCEVFLDDVFVPDDCLIGEPGGGWKVATTTLANERLRMGEELGHGGSARFRQLVDGLVSSSPLRHGAVSALGRAVAREQGLEALGARSAVMTMSGFDTASETSVLKLANIIAQREGSRDLIRLAGPEESAESMITVGEPHGTMLDHLGLPAVLFGGGTPDIQLGVIARNILKLR